MSTPATRQLTVDARRVRRHRGAAACARADGPRRHLAAGRIDRRTRGDGARCRRADGARRERDHEPLRSGAWTLARRGRGERGEHRRGPAARCSPGRGHAALERGQVDSSASCTRRPRPVRVSPVAEIAKIAHAAGALVLVDAVASIGAEPLEIDEWDLDLTALSAQKALGGPAGVCAVAISDRAWEAIEANPAAPRDSALSLLDWRERWIRAGRRDLPRSRITWRRARSPPHSIGSRRRAGPRRSVAINARETRRAPVCAQQDSSRGWPRSRAPPRSRHSLAAPRAFQPSELLAAARRAVPEAPLELAPGPLAQHALRVAHTGENARLAPVLAAIAALAIGLDARGIESDGGAALSAALAGWRALPA